MKRILFLLLLWLGLPAAAQVTTASISGRIFDENGPIEGVTVVAIHQPTNTQYYATTGRGGWYQLLDVLPGGPYTLRVHYFSYKPLTVRNLYTYAGQNVVVDADLEAGTSEIRIDEAATSLRLGASLGGGAVPVSPLGFDLVSQEIDTPVPFDVRQEAPLEGVSRLRMTPTGTNRFHGSAYAYYGATPSLFGMLPGLTSGAATGMTGVGGLILSAPLASEDYQLFAGIQYDGVSGFNGSGRFDARLGSANRLDVSGGRLDGADAWASAGLTTSLRDGAASNRAQAGWYGTAGGRQLLFADDFTLAAGPQRLLLGVRAAHSDDFALDSSATQFDVYLQDVIRMGRRMTLQAGLRFSFPFAFSPRLSLNWDLLGNGALLLRAGTAVYAVHGAGTVWKNLAAVDTRLPGRFYLTLEGIYGQTWEKAYYISYQNILDSHYALTARLERPLADRFWALAAYTRSDGVSRNRTLGGLSYRAEYGSRFATTATLLYSGYSYQGPDYSSSQLPAPSSQLPAPEVSRWLHCIEARLSQDLSIEIADRLHTLQLTAYARYNGQAAYLFGGIRYSL